jgi:hypothetical protein
LNNSNNCDSTRYTTGMKMAKETVNQARAAGSADKARPMTTSKITVQAMTTDAAAVAKTTVNPNKYFHGPWAPI